MLIAIAKQNPKRDEYIIPNTKERYSPTIKWTLLLVIILLLLLYVDITGNIVD